MTPTERPDGDPPQAALDLIDELIEVGRDLWQARLVTSHGGNLSVRHEDGAFITRRGAMMHRLDRDQFLYVDAEERSTGAWHVHEPSSDAAVHMAVYRAVPQARVVVHAHPTYAVAQSLEWGALSPINASGESLGRVPVLAVEEDEAPAAISEALRESAVVLVRAHGAYAWAETPWEALRLISLLEEAAMILYLAEQ